MNSNAIFPSLGRVRLVGTVMDVTREAAGVRVRLKVNTYQAAVVLPGTHACLQHFVRPGPVRRRVFRVAADRGPQGGCPIAWCS
jgi:hypothetical protein